jgi:cytochrome d ubiquinol oxidase subunit II
MVLGQVVTVLLVVAALAGAVTLAEVYRRRYRLARVFAVAAVAAVVTGWGVGQYPWILVDELTINDAAGAPATLTGLLAVPALAYLLWLTQTEGWSRT